MLHRVFSAFLCLTVVNLLTGAAISRAESSDTKKPARLVLMDLDANGVPDNVARSLSALLSVELSKLDKYSVISREDIRTLLKAEGMKMVMGVEDQDAVRKIGEKMNAPLLIYGSIGVLGSTYVLTLNLMDTKEMRSIRRVKQTLVGQTDGLAGAVRTAVLALSLEEEGVSHDETNELLESLFISERPKSFFLKVGAGYQIPTTDFHDKDGFAYIRPYPLSIRLDAEYHVLPWLRITATTGLDRSINESIERRNQYLAYYATTDPQAEIGKEASITSSRTPFDLHTVPLLVGAKIVPPSGWLLPFLHFSIGPTFNQFESGNERLVRIMDREDENGPIDCQPPFSLNSEGVCQSVFSLQPESKTITTWNLAVALRAGLEILLTQNIAMALEFSYQVSWVLAGDELERLYIAEKEYDNNGQDEVIRIGDSVTMIDIAHNLGVGLGMIVYW